MGSKVSRPSTNSHHHGVSSSNTQVNGNRTSSSKNLSGRNAKRVNTMDVGQVFDEFQRLGRQAQALSQQIQVQRGEIQGYNVKLQELEAEKRALASASTKEKAAIKATKKRIKELEEQLAALGPEDPSSSLTVEETDMAALRAERARRIAEKGKGR